MLKPRSILTRSLLALAALSGSAHAAFIASDDFDAYLAGSITGANGGSGFASAWTGSNGAAVVATSGGDAPMSGNALRFTTPNNDAAARRTLATTLTSTFYVSFDFQFDGGAVGNNDFLGLWLGSTFGPNIGLKSNCGISSAACTADLFVRTDGTGGVFQQNIAVGTTYTLLGKFEKVNGSSSYNRASLWIDESLGSLGALGAADVVFTGAGLVSSVSSIGFRTANLDGGGSADRLLVDNLRIATVPVPGTLALMGLGLLAVAGLTRRRA